MQVNNNNNNGGGGGDDDDNDDEESIIIVTNTLQYESFLQWYCFSMLNKGLSDSAENKHDRKEN